MNPLKGVASFSMRLFEHMLQQIPLQWRNCLRKEDKHLTGHWYYQKHQTCQNHTRVNAFC